METYQIIASQIADIRVNLNSVGLKLPEDLSILKAFEELSFFVIKNFELPISHEEYIIKSLGLKDVYSPSSIIDEIIFKHQNINDYFAIEIPLRAIESYFLWGSPSDIEHEKSIILKYLIAKLHSLIGDKTVRYRI